MKLFLPFSLAFLLIACAPPKPGTAAHQRLLAEQARENFYALKERERKSAPPTRTARTEPPAKVRLQPFASPSPTPAKRSAFANPFAPKQPDTTTQYAPSAKATPKPKPIAVVKPTPAPKPKPVAVVKPTPAPKPKPIAAAKPTPTPKPLKPVATASLFAKRDKNARSDDTIYYYDVPRGPEPTSDRYRIYKAKYASSVGKRPQDLTSDEREWVRRHYRD